MNTAMNKTIDELAALDLNSVGKNIYSIRGEQVIADFDLARFYGVENRSLKQAVRRNIDYFPDDFMFRLTAKEAKELIASAVSQNVIPSGYNTGGAEVFAFTEHGVAMLSAVRSGRFDNDFKA